MRHMYNAMDSRRRSTLQQLHGKVVNFGSDCTGCDAMFTAGLIWCSFVQSHPINKFGSEAPDAIPPILYNLYNHSPEKFYIDVLARGHSGYDVLADRLVPVPRDLEFYSAGTMCTDYSSLNTTAAKACLGRRNGRSICFVLPRVACCFAPIKFNSNSKFQFKTPARKYNSRLKVKIQTESSNAKNPLEIQLDIPTYSNSKLEVDTPIQSYAKLKFKTSIQKFSSKP